MKKFGVIAATAALVAGSAAWMASAHAQDSGAPHINLMADGPSKSPEEKEADAAREKAYKETLKKIPDAKGSSDPWGAVRTTDAPKAPAAKAAAVKKPKNSASAN